VVGRLDDVGVVFDDIDGVAHIHHLLEQVDEVAHVLEVEAVGGLVDDKHASLATLVNGHGVLLETGGHLQALQFAAREGTQRLVQVQVVEPHVHHGLQLLLDDCALEELAGTAHREVHHLGDVHAVDGVIECLARVAQAVAGFASGLDVVHEGHLGDDHALAAAHGAAPLAVEGEILLLDLVGAGKALAYVGGDVHIGRWRGTQAHADVALADIDHLAVLTAEALHQRALARACHTCHGGKDAHGQVNGDVLEVVQRRVAQGEGLGGLARLCLEVAMLAQHLSRAGAAVQQLLVVALEDDASALAAWTRSQINDVVGQANHLAVVLDEQDGVARITQAAHRVFHLLDVVVMQARAGFVQDVEDVGQRRVDVLGNLAALRLAARQGSHGAVQAQVAQPDFLKRREAGADGLLQVDGQRCRERLDPLVEACDGHGAGISDVDALDLAREHTGTQAGAVTVGAHAHVEHGIQHRGVQQALLAVDDAAVHARDDALILGALGPVGGRVLQAYLWAVEEQVQLLGAVVLDLLVEVKQAAVGIAYPAPAALAEGDVVDRVLVVEALVKVDELVDVQLAYLAQTRAARAAALGMVEAERLGIAHKGLTHTGEQQAQQGGHVRIGRYGRTGVLGRLLLVDDDGDGQVLDGIHVGTAILGQVLLDKRRERVVQLPPRLGSDGVEHERTLARARNARENRDLMLGNLERDVLEVVLARPLDDDSIAFHDHKGTTFLENPEALDHPVCPDCLEPPV